MRFDASEDEYEFKKREAITVHREDSNLTSHKHEKGGLLKSLPERPPFLRSPPTSVIKTLSPAN